MSLTKQDLTDVRTMIIDALETIVLPRFDSVDMRLDKVETRLDGVETRLDKVETRLDGVETRLDKVETHLGSMETRLGNLEQGQLETNRRLDSIEGRLKALENDIKDIYSMLKLTHMPSFDDKKYTKLPSSQKLLVLHQELITLAHEIGVTLPKTEN